MPEEGREGGERQRGCSNQIRVAGAQKKTQRNKNTDKEKNAQ